MVVKLKEITEGELVWLAVHINGVLRLIKPICRRGDCHRPGGG